MYLNSIKFFAFNLIKFEFNNQIKIELNLIQNKLKINDMKIGEKCF